MLMLMAALTAALMTLFVMTCQLMAPDEEMDYMLDDLNDDTRRRKWAQAALDRARAVRAWDEWKAWEDGSWSLWKLGQHYVDIDYEMQVHNN